MEDVDVTFNAAPAPNGSYANVHFVYHDQATYTLSGTATPDGLSVATMSGSGGGAESGTVHGPNLCFVPANPYWQWSYSGPATVSISYLDGAFFVRPQTVSTTLTTLLHYSACGSTDQTQTTTAPVPLYLLRQSPKGQVAADTATSLVGSDSFPITVPGATTTGTGTVSWDLKRPTSPGGGVSGGGKPKGFVVAYRPYIHTDAIDHRWIYGKGAEVGTGGTTKIKVTLFQYRGGKYHKVGGPTTKTGSAPQSAIASAHCGKPYTDHKFKVVASGWTQFPNGWHYDGTARKTKHLQC